VASPYCLQSNEACNIKKNLYIGHMLNNPAIRTTIYNTILQLVYIYIIYIYIFVFESILHVFTKTEEKNTWVVHLRTQNIHIFTSTSPRHSTYPTVHKILTKALGENKKKVLSHISRLRSLLRNNTTWSQQLTLVEKCQPDSPISWISRKARNVSRTLLATRQLRHMCLKKKKKK
jgi:hypothetical protein